MRIRATVVKALAAGALLVGVVGVAGMETAGALSINNFFVAKNGSDVQNSCTNKSAPCLTITHAVAEANTVNPAGPNTISVAKGTYNESLDLAGDTNLSITGQSTKKGLNKSTITGANPVLEFTPAGSTVVSHFNIIGTGGGSDTIDMAPNNVLENSDVGSASPSPTSAIDAASQGGGTVENDTISGAICTDVTKSGVPAGAPSGTLVTLSKKYPKCAPTGDTTASASVDVDNVETTVSINIVQDGKKSVELTSANGATAIPAGATLSFASTVSAFVDNGVYCAGCTVEGSTIDGSGLGTQVGIEAGPGTVATGNTVNGNGKAGIATSTTSGTVTIGGSLSGQGNSGSSNGAGIAIGGGGSGTVNVVDNSVGGVANGLAAECINSGTVNITGNTVSESAEEGAGMALLGVQGQTISGNTISGTIATLMAEPTACPLGTSGNHFTDNTVQNGLLFGVVIAGPADPIDVSALGMGFGLASTADQNANTGNIFTDNTWSGNGEANIVDLNAFETQVAPACTFVQLDTSIAAGTAISSVNVSEPAAGGTTCTLNPGTNLDDAGIGQELYVTTAATLLKGAATPTAVSVSNFIPLASSQLNAGGQTAPADFGIDGVPAPGSYPATANTYTGNNVNPDFNGSSSLDAATGSGGYYSA